MTYMVTIEDTETGERRTYGPSVDWNDEGSEFWWTEGNFGCDCNRWLSFERAAGRDPDIDAAKCNQGPNRYLALWADLADGRRIRLDPPRAAGPGKDGAGG